LSASNALCYPPASAGARVVDLPGSVESRKRRGQTISRDLRVNQMIRIPQVRVVDEEGAQLGVMPTPRALEMAQERGLDLVEVAPMASPPVVKFLDFGQYKYDLTKREKEAKRKQRAVTFKEVRLSPKIGTGDFETKVHRAIEFLEDGDRIKVTVRFRGRELTHPELGRNLIAKFVDRVKEHGVAERTPLLEGKAMHITMASLHKPKTHDGPVRAGEASDAPAEPAPAAAAPAPARASAPAATEPAATAPAAAPANGQTPQPARPAASAEPRTETRTNSQNAPAPEPVTTGE
jgi:translation initiation factor IF-3